MAKPDTPPLHLTRAQDEELLPALLDSSPDRIYFKDLDSRFLRINHSMAQFFGLKDQREAVGRTDFDFFTREHAEQAYRDEQQVIRTGQSIVAKVEKETLPGGRIRWVNTTKMPLRDRKGKIIGTMGISRDITAMRQMEEELGKERELLRTIMDTLPDNIFVKDAEGRYLMSNRAHRCDLGVDQPEELSGKTCHAFFPARIAQKFHDDDLRILASGEALLNREERHRTRDHKKRWVLTSKVPFLDPAGRMQGLVGISRDITDRKLAEVDLAKANKQLRKTLSKLKQAHTDLTQTQLQLIEAEKLKSVGRLAAGVAHEVKNPLGVIAMGLEFLAKKLKKAGDPIDGVLADMQQAVDRANQVIQELLGYSSPHELHKSRTALNEVIEHTLTLVRPALRKAGVVVQADLAPKLEPVNLDPHKISQVLVNLFMNAINAMGDGGTLAVRTRMVRLSGMGSNVGGAKLEHFRAGDQVVELTVEDAGCGIPEAHLRKIFDPFFTTNPTGKGTGLGLSVVKSIIDLHQGVIEITNRPEGGVRALLLFKP